MIEVSYLGIVREVSFFFALTVWEGDLEWFGGVSEVPHRQAAV